MAAVEILEQSEKKEKSGLHRHQGCRDCGWNCIFNAPVANKETAERSSKIKFNCNSSNLS